jgi:hypothetical protein
MSLTTIDIKNKTYFLYFIMSYLLWLNMIQIKFIYHVYHCYYYYYFILVFLFILSLFSLLFLFFFKIITEHYPLWYRNKHMRGYFVNNEASWPSIVFYKETTWKINYSGRIFCIKITIFVKRVLSIISQKNFVFRC